MKTLLCLLVLSLVLRIHTDPFKIFTKDEAGLLLDIPLEALQQSETIKNLLEDIEADDVIPLPYISSDPFLKIVICLDILSCNHPSEKQEALLSLFLEDFSAQDLYTFIEGTSYLNIPPLLEIACKKWCKRHALIFFETNETANLDHAEIDETNRKIILKSIKKQYRLDYLKHFHPTECSTEISHQKGIVCCDFNPIDNTFAALSFDGKIHIWGTSSKNYTQEFRGKTPSDTIRYDSGGKTLISNSLDDKINIFHLEQNTADYIDVEDVVSSLDVKHNNIGLGLYDGGIKIYDIITGKFTDLPKNHRSIVSALCYNPDGSLLASGDVSGNIALYNVKNQNFHVTILNPVLSTDATYKAIEAIIFGPSQTLVLGLASGDIYFYNIKNHTWIKKRTPSCVTSLGYNDQLEVIGSGHDNGETRIFDAQSGILLHILPDPSAKIISTVSFSKHKNLLATSDPLVGTKIWHLSKNFDALERATLNQLKLLALAKLKCTEGEILDLTKNDHLLRTFESLSSENQAFLAHINHVKLNWRKNLSLKIIAHKNLLRPTLRNLVLIANK